MTAMSLVAGPSIALAAGLALFVFARMRSGAIETSSSEQRAHELRVVMKRTATISSACGGGASGCCIVTARWHGIGAGGAAITVLLAVVCLVIPVQAARRPLIAAYTRVRGVPVKAFRSARGRAVVAIRLAVLIWPIPVAVTTGSGVAVSVWILLVGYLVIDPVLIGLLAGVQAWLIAAEPAPGQVRARLSAMAGPRVHARVIRARARKVANALYIGWIPGLRYVLITDYLLEEMTPAEVDAVLGHELGHGRNRDALVRVVLLHSCLLPFALALVGLVKHGPVLYMVCAYALCVATVAGFKRMYGSLAIRWELQADDHSAKMAGPAVAAASLIRLTELNGLKRDTSQSWDRAVGHPGMEKRITRLQAAAAALAPLPGTDPATAPATDSGIGPAAGSPAVPATTSE